MKQKNRYSYHLNLWRSAIYAAAFLRGSFLVLVFAVIVSGQGRAKTPIPDTTQTREVDLVHLGDVVDVDVVGSLDYDWRGTLTPEGFLDGLDKIEEHVFALCRSESDIGSDIAKYYGKMLRDPKIVVRIVDRGNRALTILDGAVKKPQRFRIRRPALLSELIILSGGITDRSNGEISVYRPKSLNCAEQAAQPASGGAFINARQGDDSSSINIRISDLLTAKAGSNPEILSGDIVTVVEASPIYLIGGVENPHQLSSREQTTLSRAIAAAGGMSKDGVESQVTIFRREGRQSKVIETDLGKIRDGQAEDIALKPFDVVSVGQKGRAKARLPPAFNLENDRERLMNLPVRIIDR
ncbi:MAG: SLBB domain-containing protein [Acidobacteriota bacterium]